VRLLQNSQKYASIQRGILVPTTRPPLLRARFDQNKKTYSFTAVIWLGVA